VCFTGFILAFTTFSLNQTEERFDAGRGVNKDLIDLEPDAKQTVNKISRSTIKKILLLLTVCD